MAGMVVKITVNGINQVQAKLEGNIERSADLRVPMKQGSILMMGSVSENFSLGGRPINWIPLAPSTIKQKIRLGYSSKTLVRSGFLRASIVPGVERMGFKLGTSVPYARIHQKGGRTGRKHATSIPARPYLVFQQSDVKQINKLVTDYITKGI